MEARLMSIACEFPRIHNAVVNLNKSMRVVMRDDVLLLEMVSQRERMNTNDFVNMTTELLRHCLYIVGISRFIGTFVHSKARLRSADTRIALFEKDMDGVQEYAMSRDKWWAMRRIVFDKYTSNPSPELLDLLYCLDDKLFTSTIATIVGGAVV